MEQKGNNNGTLDNNNGNKGMDIIMDNENKGIMIIIIIIIMDNGTNTMANTMAKTGKNSHTLNRYVLH